MAPRKLPHQQIRIKQKHNETNLYRSSTELLQRCQVFRWAAHTSIIDGWPLRSYSIGTNFPEQLGA